MKRMTTWMARGLAAAGIWGLCCSELLAQTSAAASGSWFNAATWSAGVPTGTTAANVDGGFSVAVDAAGAVANKLDVGNGAGQSGTVSVAAGADLTIANDGPLPSIRIGQAAGGSGALNVDGGAVLVNGPNADTGFAVGDLMIGDVGSGTMTMTAGTVTASDEMVIAAAPGSTGTVTISGGSLSTLRRSIIVGFDGNATLNVSGTASVKANFDLLVGFREGSQGAINQSGGTIEAGLVFTNSFTGGAGSTVNVDITGGIVNARIAYVLGQGRGTTTMNHSGGVINAVTNNGDFVISDGGGNASTYNLSGAGEVNLLHNVIIGTFEGANGTVNQSGGIVNAGDNLFVARDGVGAWNLSGGVANANHVFLGDFDTSHGTMKITGGALNLRGNLNVGAKLASNAPANPVDTQGQALEAWGTLIVSGAGGDVNVAGNLLANAGDHTRRRPDNTGQNTSELFFEIDGAGVSRIDVAGLADLTGAKIDVDLLSGAWAKGSSFDLITAATISTDYLQVAEDVGAINLSIVAGGNGQILRATLVPEPASLLCAAAGAAALALVRRRACA